MMRISDSSEFKRLVRAGAICFAGNKDLKIYGTLRCRSGKRMKKSNRVFFASAEDAKAAGFRPCGQCLREEYHLWKIGNRATRDLFHDANAQDPG